MRGHTLRILATVAASAILCTACSDDSEANAPITTDLAVPAPSSTVHEGHSDTATTPSSDHSPADGHQHAHGAATTPAVEPYPSVTVRVLEDPSGGWLLHSVPTNFEIVPENVSTAHVDGQGHMHLYIDAVKVMRLYGEWHQLPPLTAGTHEIRVELSSNDHSAMAIDGEIVDGTVTLEVSEDQATLKADDSTNAHSHEHGASDMDPEGADPSTVTDPDQTISIEIVNGEPVGGHQRVEVDLNSEVAISVTSDVVEEVHVHGYDILHSVSPGQPSHFSFDAAIPGVFEVELEGSHRLLVQLTVS